jgi:hypothetical protein
MTDLKLPPTNAQQAELDDTIEDSFPASDPPSHAGVTGAGHQRAESDAIRKRLSSFRSDAEKPSGQPTSERHQTETAFHKEGDPEP